MTTAENRLTPVSDRTPAIVNIPDKELSGDQWVNRFTGSAKLDDLIEPFQTNVRSFKSAIEAAGSSVRISATYRPVERGYMMHWSYLIAKGTKKSKRHPSVIWCKYRMGPWRRKKIYCGSKRNDFWLRN